MTISLQDALKEVLADDGKISKYEAKVLREIILADGKVSHDERKALEKALQEDHFDKEALELLQGVLLREDAKE